MQNSSITNRIRIAILLAQTNHDRENFNLDSRFSVLCRELENLDYSISVNAISSAKDHLFEHDVLLIGLYEQDASELDDLFDEGDLGHIEKFLNKGGGVLLTSNREVMRKPPKWLNKIAKWANLEFIEYYNRQPTMIQTFQPHYITANVKRFRVDGIASLLVKEPAQLLATTKATRLSVMSCSEVGHGRLFAVCDFAWMTNEQLNEQQPSDEHSDTPVRDSKEHRQLLQNAMRWLAKRNVIDIKGFSIQETIKWGESTKALLQLANIDKNRRVRVSCVLESDRDAIIAEPVLKTRSIPVDHTTQMQWTVRPQVLGAQELRLTINIEGEISLHFDQLPNDLFCEASGDFNIKITDQNDRLTTEFYTGDLIAVTGSFQWLSALDLQRYTLDLQFGEGLVEHHHAHFNHEDKWVLKAITPGCHKLTFRLVQTDQSYSVMISVRSSIPSQLDEIQAAFVAPLEAEISERLRQIDPMLTDREIQELTFSILPPKDFIHEVYEPHESIWLQEMLSAAYREEWYNLDLLELILKFITPVFIANRGAFVPFEPKLANHLGKLFPPQKLYLEYNLLCSEKSEAVQIKQNIAAYLLHEKFGHGFFYTKTRLGRQIAMLSRLQVPAEHEKTKRLLQDSAIIVNEGFATWLELTFLPKLSSDVRQAVVQRRTLLLKEANGFWAYARHRKDFFDKFYPTYDSRYREGFEYLEYIGETFNLRCAISLFQSACDIDFGITNYNIENALLPSSLFDEISEKILSKEDTWRSHRRLHRITEILYKNEKTAKVRLRKQHCPVDCYQTECPLREFVIDHAGGNDE